MMWCDLFALNSH